MIRLHLSRGGYVRSSHEQTSSWSQDQALLPPLVRDFVPAGHFAPFVVTLVTEELDRSAILASYRGNKGQPLYGTKIRANASKHKAMNYERMSKRGAGLQAEVEC